jgi:hypothetical protein
MLHYVLRTSLGSDTTYTNTLLIDFPGFEVTRFACREEGSLVAKKARATR